MFMIKSNIILIGYDLVEIFFNFVNIFINKLFNDYYYKMGLSYLGVFYYRFGC